MRCAPWAPRTCAVIDERRVGDAVLDFGAARGVGATSAEVLGACGSGVDLWRYETLGLVFGGLCVTSRA